MHRRPGSASQGGCSSSTADAPDIEDLMKRKRPHMDSVKAPASPSKRKVKFSAGTTGDLKSMGQSAGTVTRKLEMLQMCIIN